MSFEDSKSNSSSGFLICSKRLDEKKGLTEF
jgi:hypothetical protein